MHFPTFQNRAEMCARGCAVALGISIPISVALDNVLLALILISWLAAGGYRKKLAVAFHNRIVVAAFALFCLLAAGLIYSSGNPGDGMKMLGKYIDLAFVPIFVGLFGDERVRRLAWLALAAALALTLLLSYLTWLGLIPQNFLPLANSDNPDVFKKYLTQGIFLAFGALLFAQLACNARSVRERYGWWALALLAVVNVSLLTPGRTGQLILAALLLYFFCSVWQRRGIIVAVMAIGFAAGAITLGTGETGNRYTRAFDEWKNWQPERAAALSDSTGTRLEFYRNSLQIARAHPLIGTGTGSFSKVYADHVAGTGMVSTENPHNEYLNIAIQLGVIGVLVLLYLFYCVWRYAAMLPQAFERRLARGLAITFVVGCAFNSLLMDHAEGLLFAWTASLLFAGLESSRNSGDSVR